MSNNKSNTRSLLAAIIDEIGVWIQSRRQQRVERFITNTFAN